MGSVRSGADFGVNLTPSGHGGAFSGWGGGSEKQKGPAAPAAFRLSGNVVLTVGQVSGYYECAAPHFFICKKYFFKILRRIKSIAMK